MRIGWIGTGVMGAPMAGHLLAAGHELTVNTRTRSRAEGLLGDGATWADTPAAAADGAEVVVTMLGFPDDVRDTILGDGGLLAAMADGALLVDHTTSEPSLAVEIAAAAAERGIDALDAPVSGGDVGAREARLVIMCGGTRQALDRAQPLLDVYGRSVLLAGDAGAGQHTKMVNQIAISSGMVALCEALLYAYRAGLDVPAVFDTIGGGAAASFSMQSYTPRLLQGDLEPGFKIDHFVKDLGIALAEARRMGISLPGLALAEQLYVAAQGQGLGQKGTQALLAALARLSDAELPPLADG
jgi:3-hydroxyisobutyrate dehydrogenase